MEKITFIIPNHNTLPYLQLAYQSIRENSFTTHNIIILDDNSNDGSQGWLKEINATDNNLDIYLFDKQYGHTILYNIGVQKCKTEIFSIFHSDMIMAPYYDQGILKHMDEKTVISATRIEPPLHPEGKEKIVKDFGLFHNTFNKQEFHNFVSTEIIKNRNKTTKGIFAPWAMYCKDFLAIGGHDKLFAPYPLEDSDIFQRFILAGYDIIQSRDSFVYHFTCRGHKTTDDNDLNKVDKNYEYYSLKAQKNFIRKWGILPKNDDYQYPILYKKLDIGYVIEDIQNFNENNLKLIEPFCNNIYVYDKSIYELYKHSLGIKLMLIGTDINFHNDILIKTLNNKELTYQDMYILHMLARDIKDDFESGDNLCIEIINDELTNSKYPEIICK